MSSSCFGWTGMRFAEFCNFVLRISILQELLILRELFLLQEMAAMAASLALSASLSSRITVASAVSTSFKSGQCPITLPTPSVCARRFSTSGMQHLWLPAVLKVLAGSNLARWWWSAKQCNVGFGIGDGVCGCTLMNLVVGLGLSPLWLVHLFRALDVSYSV